MRTFAKRPLRQRVIALVAAYAIAFAGLFASFIAAQAVADTAAQPDLVICHSSLGGILDSDLGSEPAPVSQDNNGNLCIKSCVGCITSLAMAIAPTVSAIRLPQSVIARLDLPARVVGVAGAKANAHRSRGPPPVL